MGCGLRDAYVVVKTGDEGPIGARHLQRREIHSVIQKTDPATSIPIIAEHHAGINDVHQRGVRRTGVIHRRVNTVFKNVAVLRRAEFTVRADDHPSVINATCPGWIISARQRQRGENTVGIGEAAIETGQAVLAERGEFKTMIAIVIRADDGAVVVNGAWVSQRRTRVIKYRVVVRTLGGKWAAEQGKKSQVLEGRHLLNIRKKMNCPSYDKQFIFAGEPLKEGRFGVIRLRY